MAIGYSLSRYKIDLKRTMKARFRSKFALFIHDVGYATSRGNIPSCFIPFLRVVYQLGQFLSVVCCKIMIQEEAEVGKNIIFSPKGKIILGVERIGRNCLVHHNVTFGMTLGNRRDSSRKPRVGNQVWIGPNTLIHGDVVIGDGVTVLESSVVSRSIPDCCVAGGNPAKIIQREVNNAPLFNSLKYHTSVVELIFKRKTNA